jgi:ParB family transcriptional regulator, chromosome partitioning protein
MPGKATPKRPRKPRRKKVAAGTKGLSAPETIQGDVPQPVQDLVHTIEEAGGAVVGRFRDPFNGHWLTVASLPIDRVEPTPYQRDPSEAHVKKLATAIERVDRYLDPIVAVKSPTGFWTPNGSHRLRAMKLVGAKAITALVVPEPEVAFQILALNVEKAHNLKERSLEVIRMERALAKEGAGKETDHAALLEEPAFATLGAAYEQRPRLSGGAYNSVVRRIDEFFDLPMDKAVARREERAKQVLELDDLVTAAVDALKKAGLNSPYLRNLVVARVNPIRFAKDGASFDFDEVIGKMKAGASKFDASKIRKEDLAGVGGAPAEE